MIKIKNTKIFKCDVNLNFHWSKLPKVIKLMRENFLDLRDSDLRNSDLSYSDLSYSDLRNSDLRNSDLSGSDLSYSDLSYSDLRNSNLSYSNLSYSDLRNSNLRNSNLRNSDLRNSDLSGSDLRNAKLTQIDDKEVIVCDFMIVMGLGSCNRQTIIFNTNIGIVIQCGCFYGTEKQFKKKVKETHQGTNYEKEYLEMTKLAKIRFKRGKND